MRAFRAMAAVTLCSAVLGVSLAVAQTNDNRGSQDQGKATDRDAAAIEAKKEVESSGALERRVPCEQIIKHLDHDLIESGRPTDVTVIARHLDTSPMWVERCMLVYGRRQRRIAVQNAEDTERQLETMEEDEPDEGAPEDVEEEGVQNRKERPERERILHSPSRPQPTPGDDEGYGD